MNGANTTLPTGSEPTKIWNKEFTKLFIATFFMYFGQQMINGIISKFAGSLGASGAMMGIVWGGFSYTALAFKLISGPTIDATNKKWVMFGAVLALAISFFGFGTVSEVGSLLGFRLLMGACQAFTATVCLALATDYLPSEKFGEGIAFFSLAQGIAQMFGKTTGLNVATLVGYNTTCVIAGVVALAGALIVLTVKPKAREKKKFKISLSAVFAKEAVLPAIILLCSGAVFTCVDSFLAVYGEARGFSTSSVSLCFTVYGALILFVRGPIGKLADKIGHIQILIVSMACMIVTFYIFSFATSVWMLYLGEILNAFGFGCTLPLTQALAMKVVPPERRGAGSCTIFMGYDLANIFGPTIGGIVVDKVATANGGSMLAGYISMWRIIPVAAIIGILLLVIFRSYFTKKPEKAEA